MSAQGPAASESPSLTPIAKGGSYADVAATAAVGAAAGWIAYDWVFGQSGLVFWGPAKLLSELFGVVLSLWFLARYWDPWVSGAGGAPGLLTRPRELHFWGWRFRGLAAVLLIVAGNEVRQHAARAEILLAIGAALIPFCITLCWIRGARARRPRASLLGFAGGLVAGGLLVLAQVALDFRQHVTVGTVAQALADALSFSGDTFALFLRWSLIGFLGGAVVDRGHGPRPSAGVGQVVVGVALLAEVSRVALARYVDPEAGATLSGIVLAPDVWRAAGWALVLVLLPRADAGFTIPGPRVPTRQGLWVGAACSVLFSGLLLVAIGYPFRVVGDWLPVGSKAQAVALAREAAAATGTIGDPAQRATATLNVAHVFLLTGQPRQAVSRARQAVRLVSGIDNPAYRDVVLRDAIHVLASTWVSGETLPEAITVADEIQAPDYRGQALGEVAAALARSGQLPDALGVADTIPSPEQRAKTLSEMVRTIVSRERGSPAAKVAREVIAVARGGSGAPDPAQQAIAMAESGHVSAAVETARSIADPGYRVTVLTGVAEALLIPK